MTDNPYGSAPIREYEHFIYFNPELQEKLKKMNDRQLQIITEYLAESFSKVMKEIDDEIIEKIKQCQDPDCEPHNLCETCCPRKKLEDV